MARYFSLLVVLIVALLLPPAQPVVAAPRCFPEAAPAIADCIDGRIRSFWEAQGGLPVFGYPLGPARQEGAFTVQPFERARLELHPEQAPPYDVLLGRLGADALHARGEPPAAPEPPRAGCRHFAETGLNVCGAFLTAFNRYGLDLAQPGIAPAESLALFGLPLSPPREEQLSDGQRRTVQWFERARFEDHGAQGVLFGLLGREATDSGETVPPASAPPVADAPEPGGFVQAQGDQLVRLGRAVTLKGVNYYPQGRPWSEMWKTWDAPQMERELRLARDQLGINTVRILLPFDVSANGEGQGVIGNKVLDRMRQITRIAGDLDLRLIVALFDFQEDFPAAGSRGERANLEYLRILLGNFAGDERIIAWDLHNEPDNYKRWTTERRAPEVLDWLGRMADEVHRLAPNHLVTVGMGHYDNLWAAGPDGRRPIDYSDLVSVHIYNAPDAVRQLDELRRYTSKPVLLGEFGWPTGPNCYVRGYSEAEQELVYRITLEAAHGRTVGVLAWTLRDYDPRATMRWETREEYYGLYRPDNTLKPAAALLRDYPGELLPSTTRSDVALTADRPNPPNELRAPITIGETGHTVKGEFRNAYEVFNGRFSFGPPIGEAFVRPDNGRVVQYFAGALLAFYPEVTENPGYAELPPEDKLRLLIRPLAIGTAAASALGYVDKPYSIDGAFRGAYDRFGGGWRFGAPVSPKIEQQVAGTTMLVQYFEHGRLQLDPRSNGVEVGLLGSAAWEAQCAATS